MTSRERVEALWVQHLAGDEAAAAELAAELRAGGPLAEDLAADEDLHRLLDALGRSAADEAPFVEQVGHLVAAEASVDRFVSAVQKRLETTPSRPVARPRRRWPLVVGAALAAAAAFALWLKRPAPTKTVATARPPTLMTGALASSNGRLQVGQVIPEGATLASDEGRTCLRLADGSQLCLERDTRIRLSPGRVALAGGKVAVAVAHQKPGATFTISAGATDVVAIGTAFSVELTDASVITRVVEGAVRVTDRRGGTAVILKAHEALSTDGRWRMTSEEERDQWSLVRAHAASALLARPAPARVEEHREGAPDVTALLALADALRARGRLRDAKGICDRLAQQYPGRPEIDRVVSELRLPPPAQPWNATPAVYRINAGGDRYTDPRGNVWEADRYFTGGHAVDIDEEIDGTDMDPIYRSERWIFEGEKLAYNLPVPDGQYVVRLHFAEIWAGTVKSNMRQFDLLVEGEKVLARYDIAGEVGPMTATVKQVVTAVRDGSLDIEFKHVVENPKLSGIEVFALPPGTPPPPPPAPPTVFPPLPLPPTDALYRVNTGGREYVDPLGRRWEADGYFNDSGLGAALYVDIAGTDLDPLYQTERRGFIAPDETPALNYSFPAPSGRYLLRLHFAEIVPKPGVGTEVFDVLVENVEVLKRLDVFAEVGVRRALVKELETTVTDGALDLSFRAIARRPKVSAIEIIPLGPPPPPAGCSYAPASPAPPLALLLFAALLVRRRSPATARGDHGST